MERFYYTNIFLVSLCSLAVLTSTLATEMEDCGLINADQLSNKQKETQIDEFPWMARIVYNDTETLKTKFICQAVLIDQQHLLSLAHCLESIPNIVPYAVLLGDWNSANDYSEEDCDVATGKCSTPILIDIEELILFPITNKKEMNNDIGLLRLTRKITYTDYIRPICLPTNDIKSKEFGSVELTLTGWLQYENGPKLKKSIFLLYQHDCRRKYKRYKVEISESQLCGKACDGDRPFYSGTALMDVKDPESELPHQLYLVGLLSFGALRCSSGIPDVFTRVDKYVDWINENIK